MILLSAGHHLGIRVDIAGIKTPASPWAKQGIIVDVQAIQLIPLPDENARSTHHFDAVLHAGLLVQKVPRQGDSALYKRWLMPLCKHLVQVKIT